MSDVAELIERLRDFEMANHSLHEDLSELLIDAASCLAALQQRVEELEQMVATLLAAKRIVGAEAEARERVLREALNSLIEWQYYVTKKAKADDLREWHSRLAAARAALGEKP